MTEYYVILIKDVTIKSKPSYCISDLFPSEESAKTYLENTKQNMKNNPKIKLEYTINCLSANKETPNGFDAIYFNEY